MFEYVLCYTCGLLNYSYHFIILKYSLFILILYIWILLYWLFSWCKCLNIPIRFCIHVSGEERRYARSDKEPSNHIACTVEMLNTAQKFDVAVLDEIQMLRDQQRGWAWTRALLGVNADHVHVCGELAATDIVKQMVADVNEEVNVF